MIGSVAFHRVAEILMGEMDQSVITGDFSMAAAYAKMAADAEGYALQTIPRDRVKTRRIIWESQLALVDRAMELEARIPSPAPSSATLTSQGRPLRQRFTRERADDMPMGDR